MPLHRANRSSSATDASIVDFAGSKGDPFYLEVGGNLNLNDGGSLTVEKTDLGAIGDAFDFANDANRQAVELSSESVDAVRRASGEAFDLVDSVSGEAFDLVDSLSGEAFDAYKDVNKDVNKNANDVIKSSLSVLSNVVNGAFSFTSQAQKDATESIQKTTSEQTAMYSQSLDAVQRSVSTSLTQGNTDIIRLVMMGLVGFGLVFALIK
jgi:uncharacterized protein YukE